MENTTFRQLKEALDKAKNIAIVVGKEPSLDEMGAALSLFLSISDIGKPIAIAATDEPIVELSSLVGINKVKTSLNGEAGDLTVSFPYREGEIDKVSYTLEGGYLNIVVKAGEEGLSFSEKDVKYSKSNGGPDLLFVVGTPKLSDLGSLFNPADLKDSTVVNLDNKVDNQGFGDIVIVSPRLSSVSEIVANVVYGLGLKVDRDIAQNLMIGLTYATNDFKDPKTSYLAFEMAGVLLRSGATRLSSISPNLPKREYIHGQDFLSKLEHRIAEEKIERKEEPTFAPSTSFRDLGNKKASEEEQTTKQSPQLRKKQEEAPEDWLTPKIYKGSTNF
ncbi:MAG: hypothetical protein A2W22_04970 [Candidatus Levybacteria bacterium RBG_16_35_11]|nr:MAG: hypothetical protein A2W22_04970 [Candidatus Levybacteria bacterium RBG_16_35_11]